MNINQGQTIVMLKGLSQYDVLRHFVTDLSHAFIQMGIDVQVVDLLETDWAEKLMDILRTKNVSFFLGMNGVGADLGTKEGSLFDQIGIPFFAFLVDHPMYHLDRLGKAKSNNLIVSCMDLEHINFLRETIPSFSRQFTNVFIPHGSSVNKVDLLKSNQIVERPIDIIFAGSYTDPNEIRKHWTTSVPLIKKIADRILEQALYSPDVPLHKVIHNVLTEKGILISDTIQTEFWHLMTSVDLYIRNKIRKDIIVQLNKLPYKVELYGNGWDKLPLKQNQSFKIQPAVNFINMSVLQ